MPACTLHLTTVTLLTPRCGHAEGQPAVNTTPEENRSYPAVMKTMSVVYTSLSCLAFLVTILGSAWATRLLLHLLGTWQVCWSSSAP